LFRVCKVFIHLRKYMKNVLKLSLAAIAISALAACGGGGSSDAADTYAGNWKSKCYAYTGNDGRTYYQTHTMSLGKTTPAELAVNYSNAVAHADAGCTSVLGAINAPANSKINIGAETSFLGAAAKAIVMTFADGQARQGFITADDARLNFVVTDASGSVPSGWGRASPYTKQ
jgi:hypothetical protein